MLWEGNIALSRKLLQDKFMQMKIEFQYINLRFQDCLLFIIYEYIRDSLIRQEAHGPWRWQVIWVLHV